MRTHESIRVIIVGVGHLGAWLAILLEQEGYAVTVIAPSSDDFDRLGPGFRGSTVLGDGTQTEVLEQAKIQSAQVLVALTNHDTENLLISQVATNLYHVPQVFCGLQDSVLAELFEGHGFTSVTRSEIEIPRFLEALRSHSRGLDQKGYGSGATAIDRS